MSDDPANLANLNDIVLLPAPIWWPPAPGWYALAAGLLIALAWSVYRWSVRYRRNRYRRAALAELAEIEAGQDKDAVKALPALLKRTAMHAYPRKQVAALSGDEWQTFLNAHCQARPFTGEAGMLLSRLAYQTADIKNADLQPLIKGISLWIEQHRVES